MRFNHDPRIRIFLIGFIVLIAGLMYLTKILSDTFLYKYLNHIKSKLVVNVLLGFHWTTSIVLAFILPEYLTKYSFFKLIFDDSEFWMYLVTLGLFFIFLIIISLLFNLAFYRRVEDENNYL